MNNRIPLRDSLYLAAGAGLGAAVMALLDPARGARRRAFIGQKFTRGFHVAGREAWKQAKNSRNHVVGAVAEQIARARDRSSIDDQVLEERVKAQIGHVLSHHRIQVTARNGHVMISGEVLPGERRKLEDRLRVTRGVRRCTLNIREHDFGAQVPHMQGVTMGRTRGNVA